MRIDPMLARAARSVVLAVCCLAGAGAARASGIHVAITPSDTTVAPGSGFDLQLRVTQAGAAFNGFYAALGYDPAALTVVPTSPTSLQQGCLMTGGCSAACGNTFHQYGAASDSIAITDILLCDQVALTGPGQLYKLHFQASSTPQLTTVQFRTVRFYNAGVIVDSVSTANAIVHISASVGVGPVEPDAHALTLRAEPNPSRGAMAFAVGPVGPGASIEVFDLSGRRVWNRALEPNAVGDRRIRWDGNDASGARVRPGVYLVTLRDGARVARTRAALLQ